MHTNRSIPTCTVIPELPYPDVREAAAWLVHAFGFRERLRIGGHRIQMHAGDGAIVVTEGGGKDAAAGHAVMMRVTGIDAHYARAREAGAVVIRPPATYPYGERQYTVADLGGHAWTFSESVADVDPTDWGGELVEP